MEPPQQPTALLHTLANLKSTRARNAHGHIYEDNDVVLQDQPAAAAAAAAAAAGNGPIQGQAFQGQHVQLSAVQISLPALQKEELPLVESTTESDDNEFENALDRTIIQSSDDKDETPPTRTPPPSPSRPRRRRTSPTPSPAAGATGARLPFFCHTPHPTSSIYITLTVVHITPQRPPGGRAITGTCQSDRDAGISLSYTPRGSDRERGRVVQPFQLPALKNG
jgi:hypothetical protein